MKIESATHRQRRLAVRAGLFVGLALVLGGLVIVLMGKERRMFDKQLIFHSAFENVDGLKLDAPVRLGGLDVGRVTAITFSPDLGDQRIQVQMEISSRFGERVRKDSVARVTSRGVLGDKAIDISLGTPAAQLIPDKGEIPSGSSGDLSALFKTSGEILDNAVNITRDLRKAVAAYTQPELRDDISGLAKSAREILEQVQKGDGPAHALVYDRATTRELKAMLASASQSAARLDQAIGQMEGILKDVREGEGPVHALLYDKKAAQALSDLGTAASEVATVVHDARQSPNGAVHQLVYGDARGIFADLGAAAGDLKRITAQVRAGEGSLGAIINDPTVYEDLKTVLGNVKRNRVLRALVRYTVSQGDEIEKAGKPVTPQSPPAPAGQSQR